MTREELTKVWLLGAIIIAIVVLVVIWRVGVFNTCMEIALDNFWFCLSLALG